jgi:hypothetical protein
MLVGLELLAANGRVVDFDALAVGASPAGWTCTAPQHNGKSRWEVRKDDSAPTKPYVLAPVASDSADQSAPIILDGLTLRDGDISVRIKPVQGAEEHGGGLVFRYRDERNYYLVRASSAEKTIAVYRVQNGQRSAVVGPIKHEFPANTWSILKIVARGDRVQVYVDHRRILEGRDGAYTGSGRVGVCTIGDSMMYFDDFRVYPRA